MANVSIRIERNMTAEVQKIKENHLERAKLIHSFVDALDLDVKKWGVTDAERPQEWTGLIIAFGSAGVFSAAVTAFKVWLNRRKISDVKITVKEGKRETQISLRNTTEKNIKSIIRSLRLKINCLYK